MKTDIFIPEKLKIGFQKRQSTYTGKLAYVIYYDTKGVLRKEKSWESWRDSKINPMDIENVPTEGFVLNKKAGGYSTGWNHRQTYVRIYDPRGFEFEISIQNLLYILENTNSIKGKGLEGSFVYGWSGTELILIPTSSPDYKELTEFNELLHSKTQIKAKELILGATYLTKQNETLVYLGRFDAYDRWSNKHQGKKYFFEKLPSTQYDRYETIKSLGDKLISVVSEDPVANYANLIDKLQKSDIYFPHDPKKNEYVSYTLEEFLKDAKKKNFNGFFTEKKEPVQILQYRPYYSYGRTQDNQYEVRHRNGYDTIITGTLEEIFDKIKPMYLNCYLPNGELYKKKANFY